MRLPLLSTLFLVGLSSFAVPQGVPRERMAAFHETIVIIDGVVPNAGLLTYVEDRGTHTDQYLLAKVIPSIERDGELISAEEANNLRVDDFPGGVEASFELDGVQVFLTFSAIPVGRETSEQDGVALLELRTEPAASLVLRCGGGRKYTFHTAEPILRQPTFKDGATSIELAGGTAMLSSTAQPHAVAIESDGILTVIDDPDDAAILRIAFEEGSGFVRFAFGGRAGALLNESATTGRDDVTAYYDELLASRIETPEKVIDQAFRSAIYNLEYNWLKPFGWIECIHHWVSLFHMQQTAGAEWLGQEDRSRSTTLSQAERIHDDGRIPLLWPGGGRYNAFGGTNQYFAWQIRHYWKFTGDRAFIEAVAPALSAAIDQTFEEYDPEGDLLLAWRSQIGNQEDYLHHPHNSTGPTIEGINMLLTRAELAEALGDRATQEEYEGLAAKARTNLIERLWSDELGRFLYYEDPHGVLHLDGQYQSFIYPLIWDIVDELDAWTGMRHLRDRLIGFDGEVYCSNNFPNHVAGTWGMQAGAAQQPWGAFGLSRMGLWNETWRPLRAVSRWVMSESLRGSWPEISHEPTPAYFSPPAGLFVQAVVEALFGLEVDRPEGTLEIAPSFPDHWPSAKLFLPSFEAEYSRGEDTLEYTVQSTDSLARQLRWRLPPSRVLEVSVDGEPVPFELSPGVGCVLLSLDTPPSKRTHFTIRTEPIAFQVEHDASIAEGDRLDVETVGCDIEAVVDRCGVLGEQQIVSSSHLTASIRKRLLEPYSQYGRLGLLNFSRRTFFLFCDAGDGIRFWHPIDLTILPEYEVAPLGEVQQAEKSAVVELSLRNNTLRRLEGSATLLAARGRFSFDVDLPARSERSYTVEIPRCYLSLLSPGDNRCALLLPGSRKLDVVLTASTIFAEVEPLKAMAEARLEPIALPDNLLVDHTEWKSFRKYHAHHHPPWAWNKDPLGGLEPGAALASPKLPAVPFELKERKLIPISFRYGRPSVRVDLHGATYRKLYLLLMPLLDSHNIFAPVGLVTLERRDKRFINRTLYFPGDLDWWCPKTVLGDFATCRGEERDRFGLLPRLGPDDADWIEGKPDGRIAWNWPVGGDGRMGFPQPEYWASCLPIETPFSVLNIVELDLGEAVDLSSLTLSTVGVEPALALVAIVGETTGGTNALIGTALMPPPELAAPLEVFSLREPGALKGWKTEGAAFGIAPRPPLFDRPTLNSLAVAGETATGQAISPHFTLAEPYVEMTYHLQGGNSAAEDGPGLLSIDLVDSRSGERLDRHLIKGSHILRKERIAIPEAWWGRTVHLELNDRNTDASYAWLGLREVTLSVR
jgi:hypothetical protein